MSPQPRVAALTRVPQAKVPQALRALKLALNAVRASWLPVLRLATEVSPFCPLVATGAALHVPVDDVQSCIKYQVSSIKAHLTSRWTMARFWPWRYSRPRRASWHLVGRHGWRRRGAEAGRRAACLTAARLPTTSEARGAPSLRGGRRASRVAAARVGSGPAAYRMGHAQGSATTRSCDLTRTR